MKEPKVVERFADNGEHSHYELVDVETGNVLWREDYPQVGFDSNEEESLFPVYFEGKKYFEKDCSDVFLAFYHSKDALNDSSGVYVGDGDWVYPDGSIREY